MYDVFIDTHMQTSSLNIHIYSDPFGNQVLVYELLVGREQIVLG